MRTGKVAGVWPSKSLIKQFKNKANRVKLRNKRVYFAKCNNEEYSIMFSRLGDSNEPPVVYTTMRLSYEAMASLVYLYSTVGCGLAQTLIYVSTRFIKEDKDGKNT